MANRTLTWIVVFIVAVIVVAVTLTITSDSDSSSDAETPSSGLGISENTVIMKDTSYSPKTLIISAGDTVTFVNQGEDSNWPATNSHPTHRIYPGSDIQKCGTQEGSQIFDACSGIASGESYEFTFNEKGRWGYHNHLRPGVTGTIIVQ